ncbi:MAG: hypothetical protein A2Y55_09905 [Actinobacteria bacterium RBG_16_68_12]|nr:MAG: hypothetical protein A2Y55_09905 [Actinobacteria bacterium RBG_16_68_12]
MNLFVLGVGAGVLWGLRGWRTWTEFVRLCGVAYFLGIASLFVVLTLELVAGIPFGATSVALTGVGLVLGGLLVGRQRGHRTPRLSSGHDSLRPSLLGAVFVGAILVYLEALFRPGRLSGLGWDVWASWVPKAKGIYFSGGIDADLFASLPGPSYPPGLPALHAAAFNAMGSADPVTLHLQQWFLAIGFVAAVAGLLAPRVRGWILLPLLLLILLMPDLRNRATDLYADIPLGYLLSVAALLVILWIEDSRSWKLWAAALLLSGAMLTKREGMLFAVCIVVAALVATFRERRTLWPRLGAASLAAFALVLPWRVWFMAQNISSDAPEAGYLGVFDHLDRLWPSLELVVSVFFDYDLWLLVPTLAVASVVFAYLGGARREAVFALTLLATSVVGSAWTYWSNPSLEIGRGDGLVNRVVGSPLLMVGVLLPLLLELAWQGRSEPRVAARQPVRGSLLSWRTAFAVVIVGAALAAYPAITLAGGAPSFPSFDDCVQAPIEGQKVRVVFGYGATYPEAVALRDRALEVGFQGTDVAQDGCGRVRVFLDNVPTREIGEEIVGEANTVDLQPTVELDPDD